MLVHGWQRALPRPSSLPNYFLIASLVSPSFLPVTSPSVSSSQVPSSLLRSYSYPFLHPPFHSYRFSSLRSLPFSFQSSVSLILFLIPNLFPPYFFLSFSSSFPLPLSVRPSHVSLPYLSSLRRVSLGCHWIFHRFVNHLFFLYQHWRRTADGIMGLSSKKGRQLILIRSTRSLTGQEHLSQSLAVDVDQHCCPQTHTWPSPASPHQERLSRYHPKSFITTNLLIHCTD